MRYNSTCNSTYVVLSLRHRSKATVQDSHTDEVDLRTLAHTHLAGFVGVNLTDILDVTSDSHLTALTEVALLMKAHEAVVVGEGVHQVSAIVRSSTDERHSKELAPIFLHDFSVEDTSSDGKSVELSVTRLSVVQSETLIKNMKKESRC